MTSSIPFQTLNLTEAPPSSTTTSFVLSPPVPSDIWRKPPSLDVFDAPIIYKSIPLSKFKRVRVTISAPWKTLYDQGGLVFVLPPSPSSSEKQRRWVKSGVEFVDGKPFVSTVAADRWADWSLVKLGDEQGEVTIEFERREKDDTLWVYVIEGGERAPAREVTWALAEFGGEGEQQECWVGVYAAKPTADQEEQLVVGFKDFEVEVLE
ncbi:hypothetical protein B7463_g10399, partial [Scytalidium lignicola]